MNIPRDLPEDRVLPDRIDVRRVSLPGWAADGRTERYVGKELYGPLGDQADVLLGFAFLDAERRYFSKGASRLEVFLFRFTTPSEAYGTYTVLRPRGGKDVGLGSSSSYDEEQILAVWKERYFLAVKNLGEPVLKEEIVAFAEAIIGPVWDRDALPRMVRGLPREDLREETPRYFHYRHSLDRVVDLGQDNLLLLGEDLDERVQVDAVYAEYILDGGKFLRILAVEHGTPEKAEMARNGLLKHFSGQTPKVEGQLPWKEVRLPGGDAVSTYCEGPLLVASLPTPDVERARALIRRIADNLSGSETALRGE